MPHSNNYVMRGRSQHHPIEELEWVVADVPDWEGHDAPALVAPGSIHCVNVVRVAEPGPNANGDDSLGVLGGPIAFQQATHQDAQDLHVGVDPAIGEDSTVISVATLQHSVPGGVTISPGIFRDSQGQRWENREMIRLPGNVSKVHVKLHKVPDPPTPPTCWERIMGDDLF